MKSIVVLHRATHIRHTMFVADELYELAVLVFGSEAAADASFRRIAKPLLDAGIKTSLSDAVSKQAALNMLALQREGFEHSSPTTRLLIQSTLDAFSDLFSVPTHTSKGVH